MQEKTDRQQKLVDFGLEIPFIRQQFQNDCIPTCALMILKHFGFEEFGYDDLYKIMGSTAAGTSLDGFGYLNKRLVTSKSTIIFKWDKSKLLNQDELLRLVQHNQPVIAYVDKAVLDKLKERSEPSGRHAIVVCGKKGDNIIYNDPLNSNTVKTHINRFVSAWSERIFVYAEKNPQSRLQYEL